MEKKKEYTLTIVDNETQEVLFKEISEGIAFIVDRKPNNIVGIVANEDMALYQSLDESLIALQEELSQLVSNKFRVDMRKMLENEGFRQFMTSLFKDMGLDKEQSTSLSDDDKPKNLS